MRKVNITFELKGNLCPLPSTLVLPLMDQRGFPPIIASIPASSWTSASFLERNQVRGRGRERHAEGSVGPKGTSFSHLSAFPYFCRKETG